MKRKCLVKYLWELGTPYIQIGSGLILLGTTALSGIYLIDKAWAFDRRLTELETGKSLSAQELRLLNQKVDLIMDFWKIRRK